MDAIFLKSLLLRKFGVTQGIKERSFQGHRTGTVHLLLEFSEDMDGLHQLSISLRSK